MRDARVAELAGRQFNRVSRLQLVEVGLSERAIAHRVGTGRLVPVEQGVFAIAPVLEHDDWGKRMGATLSAWHRAQQCQRGSGDGDLVAPAPV